MNIGLLFWILMILWLLFGFGIITWEHAHYMSTALLWVLLALLGWKVFGPMLRSG